jgi:RNA polymerase sigma factor (sigma-70 family)
MNANLLIFENFYLNNHKKIESYLTSKCNSRQEAEDLAQDCFMKFFQNVNKVQEGKETSFLYTIANNLFIDQKRKESVKYKYLNNVKICSEAVSPEHEMLQEEFKAYVNNQLDSLPPSQKEVFIMNKIEKKTYEEIAAVIGLSVKSVEKKMSLALKTYREIKRYALK